LIFVEHKGMLEFEFCERDGFRGQGSLSS
jgi:hypothetical protein